jgi:MFS transporter, AAHS family, 4-hydroxybenzoate transporter
VPFFMGFGVLTVSVLWTPALLKLNGISPANTAFVVAFNGLGGFIGQSTSGRLIQRFGIVPVLIPAFARSGGDGGPGLRSVVDCTR